MLARTSTVLGLLLLLAAVPVPPARAAPATPPGVGVFFGTASLYSGTHRTLGACCATGATVDRDPAGSDALTTAMLPLFGPELARRMAKGPCAAAYVPASALGGLSPLVSGSGPGFAWSRFGPTPVQQVLDRLVDRQPVSAVMIGAFGVRVADLKVASADEAMPEAGAVFVTDLNLRARNTGPEDTFLEPAPLALVGVGLVCLAPASRRQHFPRRAARRLPQAAMRSRRSRRR